MSLSDYIFCVPNALCLTLKSVLVKSIIGDFRKNHLFFIFFVEFLVRMLQ